MRAHLGGNQGGLLTVMNDSDSVILACPSCGQKNRVPRARLSQGPRCGRCKTPLAGSVQDRPVVVTDANFQGEVLSSPLPVLLDCWAEWCGPCRMVGPIMDQLAFKWAGRVKVGKLNVDQNPQIAGKFGIRSIPTMLIFQGGQLRDQLVGALPQQEIERKMAAYM